jgi:gliding motility-associated-like protein
MHIMHQVCKISFVCLMLVGSPIAIAQTTPPHFSHNPPNAGVNNLFFHTSAVKKFLFIYSQAEIAVMTNPVTGPITIDTIWFRHGGGSSNAFTDLTNLVITMGHSTLAQPVATFAANFNVGAPVVTLNTPLLTYTPLIGAWNVPANNWTYIVLTNPFNYNYTDNLAVQIEFSGSSQGIVGHYADNGGIPITQYTPVPNGLTATATTARPMFGISQGCALPTINLGADTTLCGAVNFQLNASSSGGNYLWSTGATSQNINITTSGIYYVTVSDSCGSKTDTINVTFSNTPIANAGADQTICSGNTVTLNASGGTNYSWSPSAGLSSNNSANPLASPTSTTTYTVIVSNGLCTSIDSVTVLVNNSPIADAGNGATITYGQTITLSGLGGNTYSWAPGTELNCTNCQNPVASPSATTTYTLIVTDNNGCTSADSITIVVEYLCGEVFVPTAFSPDNSGTNDFVCVMGNCVTEIVFEIYDRWGNKVFASSDKTICWDGKYKNKELNSGVFVYHLKAALVTGEVVNQKGNISLIR